MPRPKTTSPRKAPRGARLRIHVRVMLDEEIALGPGKADLLDAIRETGSISAAAKHLGMSYRRAWLLADTMNRCFTSPLIETAAGGSAGGGARLSELGTEVLAHYRKLEAAIAKTTDKTFDEIAPALRKAPLPPA